MKIVYLTYENSEDIKAWSGTISFIANYLEKGNELVRVDKLKKPIDNLFRLLSKLFTLFGFTSDYRRNKLFISLVTKRVEKRLENIEYDVLFSPGTLYVSRLDIYKPIVVWVDATFSSLLDTYPQYSKLTNKQIKAGNELEDSAFERISKVIFSTSWAANSAINSYQLNKNKVEIIPFGSNLENNFQQKDIQLFNRSKSDDKIKLLFIGADWDKKGGDLLLSIFSELKQLSNRYELDIVGSSPDNAPEMDDIIFHGFLNKSNSSQNQKLNSLFQSSHYFILPTKAEAFGIVFCEANSYGLPVFGSNIGGIPDIIKNGVNGELLEIHNTPKQLASRIHSFVRSGDYNEKSLRAYNHYRDNFTWEKSIARVNEVLKWTVQE